MKTAVLILFLISAGCALPAKESLRPRGVDVYAEGGRSNYRDRVARGDSDDWRVGVSVHFDITYDDEYETDE